MTTYDIISAAIRNRANRLGQINRLAPVASLAQSHVERIVEKKDVASGSVKRLAQMEQLRNIPNFFPTPRRVIQVMLEQAEISTGMRVLEPNAGKGDLLDALRPFGAHLVAAELVWRLAQIVQEKGYDCRCADFLSIDPSELTPVDLVFMNPPFGQGIDAKHIQHAHRFLRPSGRLVSVASQTTCRRLEPWARSLGGYVIDLPSGSFLTGDRITAVNTGIIVADGT